MLMSDEEIIQNAASGNSAIGGTATFGSMDSDPAGLEGHDTAMGIAPAVRSAQSQQKALVSMLGDLMKNVGPDNYVFQAAKQAMQSAQRRLPGGGGTWDADAGKHQSTGHIDEKYVSVNYVLSVHLPVYHKLLSNTVE
jgi:hypothetical protein